MAVSPRRYTQQEIDDLIRCPKVVLARSDCGRPGFTKRHNVRFRQACMTRPARNW